MADYRAPSYLGPAAIHPTSDEHQAYPPLGVTAGQNVSYPSHGNADGPQSYQPAGYPSQPAGAQPMAGPLSQGMAKDGKPGGPAPVNVSVYSATPFHDYDAEARASIDPGLLNKKFVQQTRIRWYGWATFLFYLGAFLYYLYVRIRYTISGLGAGYEVYGIALLIVECLGASTIILFGIQMLWDPLHEKYPEDPNRPGVPQVALPYHIRVMIPCYKEDLDIVQRTINAAAAAVLPTGVQRTIYLCDDGKDPQKRAWMDSMGPSFVYVSGRARPKGEMNGKSGNLNNCCAQLYPEGTPIPGTELICVFDADQIAKKHFFTATVPLFDGGDNVAMVLSPQAFHNLNLHTDIFNHSNIHFWEYMQPGYESLGFISCTGTNFLVRAKAFKDAGWSPTYTLTEDFALGMELKKRNWSCRYVCDYLAIGEAPDQIRNCFQQRSRWTKGHFQIMFNPHKCPLFQWRLSFGMKLMYSSGVWSYVVGAITTPTFILIPLITIWIGVFPIIITRKFTLAATIYGASIYLLQYQVKKLWHMECLWFANLANNLLWWAYVKAAWRSLMARLFFCCSQITFKATAKGKGKLAVTAFGDLWLHALAFLVLTVTIAIGIWQLIDGAAVVSPLLISILWAAYAAIPPFLLLLYSVTGHNFVMQFACKFCYFASFICAAGAIGVMWAIKEYNAREFSGGLAASKDGGVLYRYIHGN